MLAVQMHEYKHFYYHYDDYYYFYGYAAVSDIESLKSLDYFYVTTGMQAKYQYINIHRGHFYLQDGHSLCVALPPAQKASAAATLL